jgi:predicted MFS family arabinose efflux permease
MSLDHRLLLVDEKEAREMIIFLVLLLALLFFGLGFALHLLWVVAAIVLFVWIIGFALGRGSSGRHHFYRW